MWVFSFSIHLLHCNGYALCSALKSPGTRLSTNKAKAVIRTDMIYAQRALEEEMRTLSISRFYRPRDNEGRRGDFSKTITGRAVQFHL